MGIFILIIIVIAFFWLISNSDQKPASSRKPAYIPYSESPQTKEKNIQSTKSKNKTFKSKHDLPANLVITEEFKKAFELMENTKLCAYITGKAGTGKSTLLTYFRKRTKKNIIVLAPTGIAAINVEGSTINSFFRFAPQLVEKKNITKDYTRNDLFNKIDMIVIDEISMVRADYIDGIDYSLRINRNKDIPFGGVQIIFFGDLYQLPPVIVGQDLMNYFNDQFGGFYFFNAKVFEEINFNYIELQTIFRQKDEKFKEILNNVRENKVSLGDLNLLNNRFIDNYTFMPNDISLTLSTTKKIAENVNEQRINSLQTKPYIYSATVVGKFDSASYPTESQLLLKKDGQVMMLKNDSQKRWVNGTLGIVKTLSDDEVSIEIDGSSYSIEKSVWEVIEYQYNKEEKKIESIVTGSFTQYPVKLAWAITIHKSQGQTFEKVVIDLGNGAFAHGQTYVALSRCTSLDGITLRKKVRKEDIILDPKVAEFIKKKLNITLLN